MKILFCLGLLLSMASSVWAEAQEEEIQRLRKLVDPVIYSNTYEITENNHFKYIENKKVLPEFKNRIKYVQIDLLEEIVSMYPQLCRADFEDVLTGCFSPLRGSEYYYIYDGDELLGFIFIGYGAEITESGIGYKDQFAYRYIVHKSGHIIQNGFFDISETKLGNLKTKTH